MEGKPPEKPKQPSPEALLRRLRSRLPVSPLPWQWSRRLRIGALIVAIVAVVGGAVASVVLQGEDSSSGRPELGADVSPQVRKLVGSMRLPDKVDQLVIAGFDDPNRLGRRPAGGLLVTSANWPGGGAGKALTAKLHASGGRIPPLVAVQQEGGDYRALTDLPPSESELEIGLTGSAKAARAWALGTGRSLRSQGFDLNLAPVADVATLDSPVSDRAFSDDPAIVTGLTAAAVAGCRESGVACAVTHFPGLGAASQDTDAGPATVGLDAAGLEDRDLAPFRAAFAEKVPAVVLSLAFYAAFDPVTPGALSPSVAEELLRDQMGFEGVALTDDLSAGAIAAGQGAPEASEAALAAGADMVVISDPGEAAKARAALEQAAREGAIPEDRLDQAVARVLELKRRLGLL